MHTARGVHNSGYKLLGAAMILAHKGTSQPDLGFGDIPNASVLAIRVAARNDGDVLNKLPPFKLLSDVGTVPNQTVEYDQFSGYIDRRIDVPITFAQGEYRVGVIAFEFCCAGRNSGHTFVRVSGDYSLRQSALISLDSPRVPAK
jgi:hypothetical protein